MRLLIVVLAIPTAVLTWQWWSDRSTEHTLAPVASQTAGREVIVDCQTLWGALLDPLARHGEVRFDATGIPENRIFLTHDTCDRLAAFSKKTRHRELDCLASLDWSTPNPLPLGTPCYKRASPTVYALLTLTHEAYHTAGIQNEAVTNCYATQSIAFAAVSLGAADDEARLSARAMAALLPFQQGAYRTVDCVGGGRLDLHPRTTNFPTEAAIEAPRGSGGRPGLAAGA